MCGVGAFNIDTFRRILVECVIPWAAHKFKNNQEKTAMKKKDDIISKSSSSRNLTHQADLDDYEQFGKQKILAERFCLCLFTSCNLLLFYIDDYLEMLVQFGYVTLFASAFPLASFIAVLANLVEYRADMWKLTKLTKRPCPSRLNSIGMWKKIFDVMVWTSALTNCIIFAFTSSQMRQWLPDNYTTDEFGRTVLLPHTADETVLIVFAIEHVILLVGLLVRQFIDPVPEDVLDEVDRVKWLHETYAQNARLKMMASISKFRMHDTKINNKLKAKSEKITSDRE